MIIKRIEGTTRVLGKSQGYLGLPVRDWIDPENGVCGMDTMWEPTPEELRLLNEGGSVVLTVLGLGHPPVKLEVQPRPED